MPNLTRWATVDGGPFHFGARGGRRADRSLRAYTDAATRGRFEWYRHNVILNDVLQRVVDGEIKRLMVFQPPRHGKSEQISRLLPGKWVEKHPEQRVGIASYGATLSQGLSRSARNYFENAGGELSDDRTSATEWETSAGGGAWAAGVGGGITGKGAHLGIIDDPIKDRKTADSVTYRDGLREWYTSTFYTRLEPDAAIVIVLTRWHQADLAGWLLERESSEEPEGWHVVHLPARREPEPPKLPGACTLEPDWREVGQPLCPERYGEAALRHIEANAGPREWASLYQQRPRPREGGFFKYRWFSDSQGNEVRPARPAQARWIRYWDTAGTDGDGDYTAGVLIGQAEDGLFYVADVVRGQWSPGERDQRIRATTERDGPDVRVWLEQEAGVAGKSRSAATIRKLAGFKVKAEPATGDKEHRADPFASQCEAGNVRICRGAWNLEYIEELVGFPNADHDDQVDASAGAFNKLALGPRGSQQTHASHLN